MPFSSLCRFHLRRLYDSYPVNLIGIAVSAILVLVAVSGAVIAHRQANALAYESRALLSSKPLAAPAERPIGAVLSLRPLHAAEVVKTFNSIAWELHVPVEEIAYSLDSTDRTPYQHYRITLTTKVGYSEIRKFLAILSSEMPNAALDSVHCSRPDAAAPALGCELAFSAFFSKVEHG